MAGQFGRHIIHTRIQLSTLSAMREAALLERRLAKTSKTARSSSKPVTLAALGAKQGQEVRRPSLLPTHKAALLAYLDQHRRNPDAWEIHGSTAILRRLQSLGFIVERDNYVPEGARRYRWFPTFEGERAPVYRITQAGIEYCEWLVSKK